MLYIARSQFCIRDHFGLVKETIYFDTDQYQCNILKLSLYIYIYIILYCREVGPKNSLSVYVLGPWPKPRTRGCPRRINLC